MAKRKIPSYRGGLGRRFDPWREDITATLEEKRCALMVHFGIDPDAADADVRALDALSERHGDRIRPPTGGDARSQLLSAASKVVPGLQMTVVGTKYVDVIAARHPKTRPSKLDLLDSSNRSPKLTRGTLVSLVLAVRGLTKVNDKGRKVGIKRAIHSLTQTGQPFDEYRTCREDLEEFYYRYANQVPPSLPSLTLCSRPEGQSCFSADPFLDEVPDNCKLRNSCAFWKAWQIWANFFVPEFILERRAMTGASHYRRAITPRPRKV